MAWWRTTQRSGITVAMGSRCAETVRNILSMRALWTAVLFALLACSSDKTVSPDNSADGVIRVLFIGNSLTLQNDLPRTLESIALADGQNLEAVRVAYGGYGLEDHWNLGFAQQEIRRGGWDFVVLQQGPSALEANRVNLIEMTQRYDPLIRAAGARTALYMVWPDTVNFGDFPRVGGSYLQAAEAVNGLFLPSGLGWWAAWQQNPVLPLYGPDGFHPSPLGTYLAAIVMYERLTGRDPRTLRTVVDVNDTIIDVDESTVRLLQAAAHEANTWYQYPW